MDKTILAAMVEPLLDWYRQNARILPWRENTDPYRIWVSEIMLQQTRVEAALPYFNRFINSLPTVFDLASAAPELLLKLWEGLGYYTRVRNMQKAAEIVVAQYGGLFPDDYKALLALPGIGDYTAGAISSIAFKKPVAAVDGNVLRVCARLCGSRENVMDPAVKKQLKASLEAVYPTDCPGDFTQAIMELGALICLPGKALVCAHCPLHNLCLACRSGEAHSLPILPDKRPRKEQNQTVFLLRHKNTYALQKRENKGVLSGFLTFPTQEGMLSEKQAVDYLKTCGVQASNIEPFIDSKHIFTHITWHMSSYTVQCKNPASSFSWHTKEEIEKNISIPSAFKPFLSAIE